MNFESDYLFPIVVLIGFIVYTIFHFKVIDLIRVATLSHEKKWKLKNFFGKNFHYFNQLSDAEKEIFIKRSYRLIYHINIIGRQGFNITEEIRFYVIAAYVQITFGFDYYELPKFRTILVYPDAYENKMTGKKHYGEVNAKGVIVVSWKRLVKGHKIADDAINLGLHEMAHALMNIIIVSNDHEPGLDPYLRNIVMLSKNEIERIKSEEHHLFRKYASANIYEFFAIAVENFFETPEKFQKEFPKLYQHLVLLLKQDPLIKKFR